MYVTDSHLDLAYTLMETGRDFAEENPKYSLSLPALRRGGVGCFLATIFAAGEGTEKFKGIPAAKQFELYDGLFRRFEKDLALAPDLASMEKAEENGLIGVSILLEGADPLKSPSDLAAFHAKGVRFVGPAWNNANPYASGINLDRNLTPLGRELLSGMNSLGIAADLSHLCEKCFWDVFEAAGIAPFASHSNARAVTDIPRNLNDRQIEAVASRGGVIGLNFCEGFMRRSGKKSRAQIPDLLAHADHIFDRAGAGVLSLGTDFDGGFGPDKVVEGLEDPSKFDRLASSLAEHGYSDEDVRGVMGGNFRAYLGRIWGKPGAAPGGGSRA